MLGVGRAQVPRAPAEGGVTGEGRRRPATPLCQPRRPRSRPPQQGNRGAADRVVPKDAVLQPLHQHRRCIRADKAHEARRRTAALFNAVSPNAAQMSSARASLKRQSRADCAQMWEVQDITGRWAGREHTHAETVESRSVPPSAHEVGACVRAQQGSERSAVECARRRQKGRVEDADVQVERGRREGGGRRAAEDFLRGRAHAPVRPWPPRAVRHSARPRPVPHAANLGRAMSDEGPNAAILAAGVPSRMRGL